MAYCCAVTISEHSTTEVTLPSCLPVQSEHVALQSKWQSAGLDLILSGFIVSNSLGIVRS